VCLLHELLKPDEDPPIADRRVCGASWFDRGFELHP
jgi:hypothetical protein